MPFFFTKSCRGKRSEKSAAKKAAPAIFDVENSISNVAYNKPIVAADTKYVAENIFDVFSAFYAFPAKKRREKLRYPYCILRKTARTFS